MEKKIENWWSDKLPFIMSVKGEYSYYAIDFGNPRGAIIMGEEPEFEEACVVAEDFEDFLEKLFNHEIILWNDKWNVWKMYKIILLILIENERRKSNVCRGTNI